MHSARRTSRMPVRRLTLAVLVAIALGIGVTSPDTVAASSGVGGLSRTEDLAFQPCRMSMAPEHERAARSANLGCPTEIASPIEAVEQFFELGVMLWRGDSRTIYVLSSQGVGAYAAWDRSGDVERAKAGAGDDSAWRSFADTYYEGQAEVAGFGPPDERLQEPVRGFGKLWREQLSGPTARLGWATTYERRVWAAVQQFERGLVFRTETGRVYVLRQNGTWASIRG